MSPLAEEEGLCDRVWDKVGPSFSPKVIHHSDKKPWWNEKFNLIIIYMCIFYLLRD